MGRSIIRQPNGKFAVFSSVSDSFIALDCTYEDLVESFGERGRMESITNLNNTMRVFRRNKNAIKASPYGHTTWEEAVKTHKRIAGKSDDKMNAHLKRVEAEKKRTYTFEKDLSKCILWFKGVTLCQWYLEDGETCHTEKDVADACVHPHDICPECYRIWADSVRPDTDDGLGEETDEKVADIIKGLPNLDQVQYSTGEQITYLLDAAVKLGLYDAAEVLRRQLNSKG